jgi:hypothetical protein
MKAEPLKNYKSPNYPTIEVVFTQPDILIKNMPQRWQTNKLIVTAMFSFSLYGCIGQNNDAKHQKPQKEYVIIDKAGMPDTIVLNTLDSAAVAPIFVHGSGVGASGCVMISPPVYLSEEEAKEIIIHELKKEGIKFDDTFKGDSISIKRKKIIYNWDATNKDGRTKEVIEKKKLFPDAYNKDMNMILEYVSYVDYDKFCDQEPEMSSVSSYDIKGAAEKIRETLRKNGKLNAVVFYDPVGWADKVDRNSGWDQMEKSGKKNATEQLKQQVADFVEWLKKEELKKK